MAEFSKQYCELEDPDFPYDFDIFEVAKDIPPGHCVSMICEGLGFVAIGRDEDEKIILAMPVGYDKETGATKVEWKPLTEFII